LTSLDDAAKNLGTNEIFFIVFPEGSIKDLVAAMGGSAVLREQKPAKVETLSWRANA
jgi:hypothetical protein